ncbi:sporulation protein [Niallia endozanthoxylica]|uniref:Sporulation protein n=1 Tax=Niallia endozanthoxylica TaxID=2036016 RepID=A0A5J5I028_9BACI|nr:sporulation protein [Niallia endozanthoxylica]KAA9028518.1 sporulation protein [Niallia endozanthoxylica]
MLLRKTMSLLGIGSAKIDLILEKRTYAPGEKVSGYFLLKGGTVDQTIKHIHCDLVMVDDEKEQETVVDTTTILSSRKIQSNEEDQLSFSFTIPEDSERSRKNLYYYFKSKLVFHEGMESKDHDIIYLKSNL